MAIAKLALEDGTVFTGRGFGAAGETTGEVVFNTSMTGYQEVLTDPSYKGQIVTMTYPLIGNYGITGEDRESGVPHVAGFIVRENARNPSNFRSESDLNAYLAANKIVGIEGIDDVSIGGDEFVNRFGRPRERMDVVIEAAKPAVTSGERE